MACSGPGAFSALPLGPLITPIFKEKPLLPPPDLVPGLRGQHPTRSSCPQLLRGHWQVWPVPVVSRPTPQVAPVTRHCLMEQPPSAPGPKSGAQEPPGPMSSGPAPSPGIPLPQARTLGRGSLTSSPAATGAPVRPCLAAQAAEGPESPKVADLSGKRGGFQVCLEKTATGLAGSGCGLAKGAVRATPGSRARAGRGWGLQGGRWGGKELPSDLGPPWAPAAPQRPGRPLHTPSAPRCSVTSAGPTLAARVSLWEWRSQG